jgi:transglutaminase-like putative cysteine protease
VKGIAAERFKEWTAGLNTLQARVAVFERIRDIRYAIVPELNDARRYAEILRLGKGSCTPKHFLLCSMYQQLGLPVLYAVYPFSWAEVEVPYPAQLRSLAEATSTSYHLACRVEIEGRLVLVDATLDPLLEVMGLPVNRDWDGLSDTRLAVHPSGEEELYHPSEAASLRGTQPEAARLAFTAALNRWLEELRRQPALAPSPRGGSDASRSV